MGTPGLKAMRAKLKQRFLRVLVWSLYITGLLRAMQRFAGFHVLCRRRDSRLPHVRKFSGSKYLILCYHRVGIEGVPLFSRLEPGVFEAQMRYLRAHYRIVSLRRLCDELREGNGSGPALAITFDDGYQDLYKYAFPVLQKYQIPATIYLIGECVETSDAPWYDRIFVAVDAARGPSLDVELETPRHFPLSSPAARASAAWEIVCYLRSIPDVVRRRWCSDFEARVKLSPERLQGRMLNWEQVREMDKGGVLFGAHTMSHPAVSRLENAELESELVDSKRLLESRLDKPVHDFAYPFGKPQDCGALAEGVLAGCGYQSAVTTIEGFNTATSHPYRLRRVQIGDDDSLPMFAFNIARVFLESSVESDSALKGISEIPAAVTPDMGADEA